MDILAWLRELGLERYGQAFQGNEIAADILPKLTADDLKDIGVTIVGHRRKLLEAIGSAWSWSRPKRCGRCANGPIIPMRPTLRCAPGRDSNSSGDSKLISSDIIDLSECALALDPQNERAMVDLAFAFNDRVTNRWDDDPAGDIARADKLADSALALQPDDARAHLAKAEVFFNKQQWRAAISQAEAALADDPNYADAHANLSFRNLFLGHSEDAFAGIETALRLSPRDPDVSLWQFFTCHLHTHLAQWEQAIEWCGKSIASGSQIPYLFVDLAAANAWAGHDKEARDAVAQLQKVYPGFTVQTWAGIALERRSDLQRAISAHLRRTAQGGSARGREEDELNRPTGPDDV